MRLQAAEPAELAGTHPVGEDGQRRVILEEVAHLQDATVGFRGCDHGGTIFQSEGERLFHKDIEAGIHRLERRGAVRGGGRGDGDCLQRDLAQCCLQRDKHRDTGRNLGRGGLAGRGGFDDRGECAEGVEIAHQVAAPIATTKNRQAGNSGGIRCAHANQRRAARAGGRSGCSCRITLRVSITHGHQSSSTG